MLTILSVYCRTSASCSSENTNQKAAVEKTAVRRMDTTAITEKFLKAFYSVSLYSPALYPTFLTVLIRFPQLPSFCLRVVMCISTVLLSPSKSYPHTLRMIFSRVSAIPLFLRRYFKSSYSLKVRLHSSPQLVTMCLESSKQSDRALLHPVCHQQNICGGLHGLLK